jgi:hypothetical protein
MQSLELSCVIAEQHSDKQLLPLKHLLLKFSFFNLFLVTVLGVVLRSYPFINIPFDYKFFLHGHSHFAFCGWVMPVLIWMILQYYPHVSEKVSVIHWRIITSLVLVSAYGMLASFPFQGYGLYSISFSTLSIAAGYYLFIVFWKASKQYTGELPVKFLRAALVYYVISSLGPFATGPIAAIQGAGSHLYFDAIYFYLHFQYNGWFTFVILGVLYSLLQNLGRPQHGQRVFTLFTLACPGTYFLSTLWHHPPLIFYVIGGITALLQVIAVFYLLKDIASVKVKVPALNLLQLGIIALALKTVLQVLSALPVVADMAYNQRSYIIAYLHLVLLGFVTLSAFGIYLHSVRQDSIRLKRPVALFLFAFCVTELVLVVQPVANFHLPFTELMLLFSLLFPAATFVIFQKVSKNISSAVQAVTA